MSATMCLWAARKENVMSYLSFARSVIVLHRPVESAA